MLADVELKEGQTVESAIARIVKVDSENPDKKIRLIAAFVPGSPEGAWRDLSVKSVSNGNQWALFEAYLANNGFVQAEVLTAVGTQ